MQSIIIATMDILSTYKTGKQLFAVLDESFESSPIVGSDKIRIHTGTSNREAASSMEIDLLKNDVWSVRCVVHTFALAVRDVFMPGTEWQNFMDTVNKTTKYFRHHPEANMMFRDMQRSEVVSNDHFKRLNHSFETR